MMSKNTLTFKSSFGSPKTTFKTPSYPRYVPPKTPANLNRPSAANLNRPLRRYTTNKMIREALRRSAWKVGAKTVVGAGFPMVGAAFLAYDLVNLVEEINNSPPGYATASRGTGGWTIGDARNRIDWEYDGWQGVAQGTIYRSGYHSFWVPDSTLNRYYVFPRSFHFSGSYWGYPYTGQYVTGGTEWPFGTTEVVTPTSVPRPLPYEWLEPQPFPSRSPMPAQMVELNDFHTITIEVVDGKPSIKRGIAASSPSGRNPRERKSQNQAGIAAMNQLLNVTSESLEVWHILLRHFDIPQRTPPPEALIIMAQNWDQVEWDVILFDIYVNIAADKVWGKWFAGLKSRQRELNLTATNVTF